MDSAFTALVADALGTTPFRLLDVGCSGGLDPRWRAFGPRLRAIGIDASRGRVRAARQGGDPARRRVCGGVRGRRCRPPVDLERRPGLAADHGDPRAPELHAHRARSARGAARQGRDRGAAAPQCLGDDRARRQHEAGGGGRAAGVARLDGFRLSQDRHRRLGLRGAADLRRPAEARRACWACSSR